MGNYTDYDLTLSVFKESNHICGHEYNSSFCPECGLKANMTIEDLEEHIKTKEFDFYNFEESCKWYDAKDDVKEVSKKYPNIIFQLDGDGEESGDIWRIYFLNGKYQNCEIKTTYEPFDVNKVILTSLKN